jgi:flagellar hook-length control protein FliK
MRPDALAVTPQPPAAEGAAAANPAAAPGIAPDASATPGALGQAGAAGVTAPQATAPAAPAAGTPPPAAPTPPPATQVAMQIAPLRLDADGIHRLTVNLHPADLGPVQVVAEIRNGDITVQLTGTTDAGNDALRQSLDELRRELQESGFRNTTLDLRQGNAQDQARQQFQAPGFVSRRDAGTAENAAPTTPEPTVRRATAADGRIDIDA